VIGSAGTSPTTDGRYVFWIVADPANPTYRSDLLAYDSATNSSFGVAVNTGGVNRTAQTRGGVLVWVSHPADDFYNLTLQTKPITSVFPTEAAPDPGTTDPDRTYYDATGHFLSYGFRAFWQSSGGLPVFGYPLTEEFTENGFTVQYTERQRFEYHQDLAGTPYVVELGLLGTASAQHDNLLNTPPFQDLPFNKENDDNCLFFKETSHRLCFGFRSYWQSHGLDMGDLGVSYRESLALFGYPISEEFVDPQTGYVTQYFERAVFEYHPENAGTPYTVLLKRLGASGLQGRGWMP